MKPIYLRYRNSTSDPWSVPSLTIFPSQPDGSLPAGEIIMETAPEFETPCGCTGESTVDDHYILKCGVTAIPQSATRDILSYLLNFKQANYHEAQFDRFATGDFISVTLSLLHCKDERGMSKISFRLAAAISDIH